MDILYALQQLREGPLSFLTPFMSAVSSGAIIISVAIIGIAYWAYNKRFGTLGIFSLTFGFLLNSAIKVTACEYRPWVLDSRLTPASTSSLATGYSMPSAHATLATAALGTFSAGFWKQRKWVSILCGVLLALVMFSRMWLGCHTLADVLVGFAACAALLPLVRLFLLWGDGAKNRDALLLVLGIVIGIVALTYGYLKPYPIEYTTTGELLVDPYVMVRDYCSSVGVFWGALAGWFLERHFVKFTVDGAVGMRIARVVAGVAGAGILYLVLSFALGSVDINVAHVAKYCLVTCYCLAGWPWVFTHVEPRIYAALSR